MQWFYIFVTATCTCFFSLVSDGLSGLTCREAVIAVVSGCDMNAPCPSPPAIALIRDTNNLAGGANAEVPPSPAGFCALHLACQV